MTSSNSNHKGSKLTEELPLIPVDAMRAVRNTAGWGAFYNNTIGVVALPLRKGCFDRQFQEGSKKKDAGKAPYLKYCDECQLMCRTNSPADNKQEHQSKLQKLRPQCQQCGWRNMTRVKTLPLFNNVYSNEVGMLCGETQDKDAFQIFVIDIDVGGKKNDTTGKILQHCGLTWFSDWLTHTGYANWVDDVGWITVTPSGGLHLYFLFDGSYCDVTNASEVVVNQNDNVPVGIDVRTTGGQIVAPGSYNRLKDKFYRGVVAHCPFDTPPTELKKLSQQFLSLLRSYKAKPDRGASKKRSRHEGTTTAAAEHGCGFGPRIKAAKTALCAILQFTDSDFAEVKELCKMLSEERVANRGNWIALGNLLARIEKSDRMLGVWKETSRKPAHYAEEPDETFDAEWQSLGHDPSTGKRPLTVLSLHEWAQSDNPTAYNHHFAAQIYNFEVTTYWGEHKYFLGEFKDAAPLSPAQESLLYQKVLRYFQCNVAYVTNDSIVYVKQEGAGEKQVKFEAKPLQMFCADLEAYNLRYNVHENEHEIDQQEGMKAKLQDELATTDCVDTKKKLRARIYKIDLWLANHPRGGTVEGNISFKAFWNEHRYLFEWDSQTLEPITKYNKQTAKSLEPKILRHRLLFNSYYPPKIAMSAEAYPFKLNHPAEWWREENFILNGEKMDCHFFLWRIIYTLWCRRDIELFKKILKLLAWTFKYPDKPPRIGLFLYSECQGAGKTTFYKFLANEIMGMVHAYFHKGPPGKFNAKLARALHLIFDDMGEDDLHKLGNDILTIIDQSTCVYEEKFQPSWVANCYWAPVFLTNNKDLVRTCIKSRSDRRVAALDVSSEMTPANNPKEAPAFWAECESKQTRECALQIYSYMQQVPCEDLPDMINRLEFNTPFKNELVSAMRKKHEEFVEWLVLEAEWAEVRTVLYEWEKISANGLDTDQRVLPALGETNFEYWLERRHRYDAKTKKLVPHGFSTTHIFDVFFHATQHSRAHAMQSAKFLNGLATLLGKVGLVAKKYGKQPIKSVRGYWDLTLHKLREAAASIDGCDDADQDAGSEAIQEPPLQTSLQPLARDNAAMEC